MCIERLGYPNSRHVGTADRVGLLTAVHDCGAQVMLWQLLLALTDKNCNRTAHSCLANVYELQLVTYTRLRSAARQPSIQS